MIIEGQGSLLEAQADALVNTVNTVGVMGKGVALQFKQAFPANFTEYEKACRKGQVELGRMFVTHTGKFQPRLIVNFPTKKHWKNNSQLADIRTGLEDLVRIVKEEKVGSIALPPLGCGLGGLRWEEVRPLIEEAFASLTNVETILYPPGSSPAPTHRVVRTIKPELTAWSAALIRIVQSYMLLGFEATHIEAQKLLYSLKEAGEPLKTNFTEGPYGPYDEGMKHALLRMEGHYINGFGEGGRLDPVSLAIGASTEADRVLANAPETDLRIDRVLELIDGFESPYGLELLTTVHWVVTKKGAKNANEAVALAHAWNDRKKKVLDTRDLHIAWDRLYSTGWFATQGSN